MENAVFITHLNQISQKISAYDRIYFGEEFCELRIQTPSVFKKAIKKAESYGLKFTCVSPYFTESGIKKLPKILDAISFLNNCEVVANDWGSAYLIQKKFPNLILIAGRLLTRQRRGILINSEEKISDETKKYLSSCSVNLPEWKSFLSSYNIERIELDNSYHGIEADFTSLNLKTSLYYPYGYLTTTRYCLFNQSWRKGINKAGCDKPCYGKIYKLDYPTQKNMELYQFGNTQIFKNINLPKNLSLLNTDRLINNAEFLEK